MDLFRITEVLRRHRLLAIIGVLIATGLAVLTFIRTDPVYQSDSILFVTEEGAPWVRVQPANPDPNASFNTGRFVEAASLYASFSDTDLIRNRVKATGDIEGEVETALLQTSSDVGPLPLIRISAFDTTKEGAVDLATRWTAALTGLVRDTQKATNLPRSQSILLEQIKKPQIDEVEVFRPRSLTRPVAIFLAVIILFTAIIFGLDSQLRRRDEGVSAAGTGTPDTPPTGTPTVEASHATDSDDATDDSTAAADSNNPRTALLAMARTSKTESPSTAVDEQSTADSDAGSSSDAVTRN